MITQLRLRHNNVGYSLFELLIVINIVAIMASFIVIRMFPLHEVKETEYFLEQLSNDLHYFQQYAIANQKAVHVQFNRYNYNYFAYTDHYNEPFLTRSFPKSITLNYGSFGHKFSFLASGNISKFGTLIINTSRADYKIVFLLGKGRFYVKEL